MAADLIPGEVLNLVSKDLLEAGAEFIIIGLTYIAGDLIFTEVLAGVLA